MTDRSFTVAALQMNSRRDLEENLGAAERLVEEAAGRGAVVVALPELFNCCAEHAIMAQRAEPIPGPTSLRMAALARKLGIFLLAGSFAEEVFDRSGNRLVYNTSLLISSAGEVIASYRKIHLFDVSIPGGPEVEESRFFTAGDKVRAVPTPQGCFGLSICYDLRFGGLFEVLADRGAEVLFLPSAFTVETGRDHWEILLRARAIGNQAYVVAPNQVGEHAHGLASYGHSAIVDPWGEILAEAGGEGEAVICAEISLGRLREIRSHLPALAHRRSLV
ncbi:MAG: carbon-nitrogen hydrolase family protein [Verrucomicrobiales bacterium]